MTKLPKWPVLLVTGDNITPEQSDLVIVRTTWWAGVHSSNRKWNAEVKKVFRIRSKESLLRVDYAEWDRVNERIGSLDVNYLCNDLVQSSSVAGPNGWCGWDGTIGCAGAPLMCKWPEVEDVHQEWVRIAHAFPFLKLTAQLARVEWDDSPGGWITGHTPLVTWNVANGAVLMRKEPGEMITPVRTEQETQEEVNASVRRLLEVGSDIGVRVRRLRSAVRRCERAAARGR